MLYPDGSLIEERILATGGSGVVIERNGTAIKVPLMYDVHSPSDKIDYEKEVYQWIGKKNGIVPILDMTGVGIQMLLMENGNLDESSILPLEADMKTIDDNGYSMFTDIGQFGAVMYEIISGQKCEFDLFKDQPPGPATAAWPPRDSLPGMLARSDAPNATDHASFAVPRELVKRVKTLLETRKRLNPAAKIRAITAADGGLLAYEGRFLIPSTFRFETLDEESVDDASAFLVEVGLEDQVHVVQDADPLVENSRPLPAMESAIRDWFSGSESTHSSLSAIPIDLNTLVKDMPRTYSTYGSLLLLPQHTFQSPTWQKLLAEMKYDQTTRLFESICKNLKVTHIATNAPIPLHNSDKSSESDEADLNIVRTPTNLTPLFGDFGPICSSQNPTIRDFAAAFWTHTKQNGLTQFWAPRYTMFSRGNITEKARVLKMPSVAAAVLKSPEIGCSAVDLYAGIGYFAFSYVAAGVQKVLCWDLNPWSIEGLRRGAVANKWSVQVFSGEHIPEQGKGVDVEKETRLVAFVESNERALARIESMRDRLPPIRHVNCGLLPTSQHSYAAAAAALDSTLGGWVHVHENFAVAEIEAKAEDVRRAFVDLMGSIDVQRGLGYGQSRSILVEHVQRVKSYAPGVFHCVVDISVSSP
ncbi:hypothetical protein MBLNU459_g1258t1 [Dothideomycetes sp. NU459]